METSTHSIELITYANKVTKFKHNPETPLCIDNRKSWDLYSAIKKQVQKEDNGEVIYV